VAAFLDGLYAQAIPNFGPERMGAPVMACCRMDDKPIRSHEPIVEADAVIVLDPTLLYVLEVFDVLEPDGYALINSSRSVEALGLADMASQMKPGHLITVGATEIAMVYTRIPVPNTTVLGAFSALSGVVSMPSVHAAISRRFPGAVGMLNIQAANLAASTVRLSKRESADA
jgi:pyruvate ferredoxin oxidoreductase gamma subunit